ncbi:MAG: PAS domain-containing protein, partial [Chthoniobacteraceae bacterium]
RLKTSSKTCSLFGREILKRPESTAPGRHLQLAGDFQATLDDPHPSGVKSGPPVWSRLDVLKEADRLVAAKYCPPGLVVNDGMEIIQFRGEVAPYLKPGTGEASLNLFKMMLPSFVTELRSAIAAARKGNGKRRKYSLHLDLRGESREVTLEVLRIEPPAAKERAFVVNFAEVPPAPALASARKRDPRGNLRADRLADELAAAQEHLQSISEEHEATSEELRSANEEIQASNEELQSTNEELETAKEELQSTNEELTTVNEELRHNNQDITAINDDLNNLLHSVNLPVIMLGRDLRIRRFTPGAERLFKLIPTDVGRAITDIQTDIEVPDLDGLVREVIDGLCVKEREIRDRHDRWHRLQARPFETADNKIAGAVLIFFDIDDVKRGGERLRDAANYADAIIETVREPLLVLDGRLRVKRATESFCKEFRVSAEATEDHLLYQLGNGQWNIPALRKLLEEVLPKRTRVTDFEVEHTFPKIGKRTLLLNARRVESGDGGEPLIVLAFSEVAP